MSDLAQLDAVFAEATDFELCDAIVSVVETRYGFYSLLERDPSIPRDRWIVHSVWGNTGFFECEGYSRFWGAETDHLGFAEALREIDLPILASIIEKAVPLVPREIMGNNSAVESHLESEAARTKAGNHMDAKLISEKPDIRGRLAKYVRSRRAAYLDLLDGITKQIRNSRHLRNVR